MAIQISTDGLEASTATDDLRSLHRKSLAILKRLQTHAMDPETGEKAGPTFPISKAAELVDRTASAIREAERDGRLPERGRTPSGHRLPYNLTELDHMRKVFGTRRWRDTADTPAIISVSNFKGASANRRLRSISRSTSRSRGIAPCSSIATARRVLR